MSTFAQEMKSRISRRKRAMDLSIHLTVTILLVVSCQNPLGPLVFEQGDKLKERIQFELLDGSVQATFKGRGRYDDGDYRMALYCWLSTGNQADSVTITPDSVSLVYLGHSLGLANLQDLSSRSDRSKGKQVFCLTFETPALLDEIPRNAEGHFENVRIEFKLDHAFVMQGQFLQIGTLVAWERKAYYNEFGQ